MSNELTEAERVVAEMLSQNHNYRVEPSRLIGPDEFTSEAREIVSAVAPIIKRDTLAKFGDRMGRFNP
jgi:hypothetical protein